MNEVQQDVLCVLLQTLLNEKLITKEIYDRSRNRILGTVDFPEFFCYGGDGKGGSHGST